jgi:hypothetical protein
MKMAEVVGVAKKRGLNPFGKKKLDLIREIQLAEGNRDCYNRNESKTCGQAGCAWRSDCK